jgi:predicted Fe-Mo cluster-binding NifX family protein
LKEEDTNAFTVIDKKDQELTTKDVTSPERKTEEKKEGDTSKSPE